MHRQDYEKWDLAHVTVRPTSLSVREFYRQLILLYRRVVLRPSVLLQHASRYSPRMLVRMAAGALAVWRQYRLKMREA